MAAFDSCGSCRLTLIPFLAHFSLFYLFFLYFLLFIIIFFFASIFSFFSLSLFFFLSIFFSSLSPFFQVSQSWSFCKLGYSLNRTCSDFPTNFPHTSTFVCWNTKSQVCGVGVSFRVIPSIQLEQFPYSWALYVLCSF